MKHTRSRNDLPSRSGKPEREQLRHAAQSEPATIPSRSAQPEPKPSRTAGQGARRSERQKQGSSYAADRNEAKTNRRKIKSCSGTETAEYKILKNYVQFTGEKLHIVFSSF